MLKDPIARKLASLVFERLGRINPFDKDYIEKTIEIYILKARDSGSLPLDF